MKHRFNGRTLDQCENWNQPLAAIVVLPLNGMFPSLDLRNTELVRPLQQVTLRPDMLSTEGYLRLGYTPGDESNCWIHPRNIQVIEVLGRAEWKDGELRVFNPDEDLRSVA